MSNNKDTNKIEPKFNEMQAYEELRMIFAIAIQTQNFNNLEERISAWERKYPLAEFIDPEIIRKVKTILNKEYLSRIIGDYLASQILHEKEKQKKLYDDLKAIIDSSKKSKDFKTAQKQINNWKSNLANEGLTLYSFDRFYRAKVCTLLLLPSKELKNQEEATSALKLIKENANSLSSEQYSKSIADWQNKYSLADFPKKLKDDLNNITAEAFKSISEKRNEETALLEVQSCIASQEASLPMDSIARVLARYDYTNFSDNTKSQIEELSKTALSIQTSLTDSFDKSIKEEPSYTTSTQFSALNDLKNILNTTPHNMDTILNWIYLNRKVKFNQFSRDEIIKQFTSVGYKIPVQSSYYIPTVNSDLAYQSFSKIDSIRKDVILNYLGIISQGNSLSSYGKDNIAIVLATSEEKPVVPENSEDTKLSLSEELPVVSENSEEAKLSLSEELPVVSENSEEAKLSLSEELPVVSENSEEAKLSLSEELPVVHKNSEEAKLSLSEENPLVPENSDKAELSLPVFDNSPSLDITDANENSTSSTGEKNDEEETIYNIVIEDIIHDPLVTYDIPTLSSDSKKQDNQTKTKSTYSKEPSYSLTLEDQKNIEEAHDLSTYVDVSMLILNSAISRKSQLRPEIANSKNKISQQKNNSF